MFSLKVNHSVECFGQIHEHCIHLYTKICCLSNAMSEFNKLSYCTETPMKTMLTIT